MKKVIYIIALLIGATTMAQTITVNGTPMLVSDDISFPFWLESGSSISPEVPVSSISVLEFNIVPNNNGNDMVFNQVISVTEGQTVPEGKTWKVESILMENQTFDINNTAALFIPSGILNIIMNEPLYDSIHFQWDLNSQILPSGGNPITQTGYCYSSNNEQPSVNDSLFICSSNSNEFSSSFFQGEDLQPNTTYYIRSFATSLDGIFYSNTSEFTTNSDISPSIGSYAYGGILFYIDASGDYALVAAIEDLDGDYEWGCHNNDTDIGVLINGAGSNLIGSGYQNTQAIISDCNDPYNAASACENYQYEDFGDWYLPSILELNEINNTIGYAAENIANLAPTWYWSSTQENSLSAYFFQFLYGGQIQSATKSNLFKVRPVRTVYF